MTPETIDEMGRIDGEAQTAECDICGGHMVFDPETQGMKCPFCGGTQAIDMSKDQVVEIDLNDMSKYDFNWNVEKKVIVCENCGGETITEPNDETGYCAFCGSQHILRRDDEDMGMKPQGLLPFQLTQDDVRLGLKKWIKRRYLAPRDLKHRYLNRNLKGIYIPYWTFDADTNTHYSCQIGTYYYTGSGEKRKRHIRWRHHSGSYHEFFDDKLVCGIQHEHQKYIKRIEPYDMRKIVDYSPEYLAGYYAQKYVVMPNDALNIAQSEMESEISASIRSSLPGDTSRFYNQRVKYSDVTFKHILLPLYMMSYAYKNKMYHVMVNGQTGEVQGQSPLSPIKVTLLTLAIIAIMIIIYVLYNR